MALPIEIDNIVGTASARIDNVANAYVTSSQLVISGDSGLMYNQSDLDLSWPILTFNSGARRDGCE